MNVERLNATHAQSYRALMLEAYAAHPESFTSSAEERALLPLSWWEERLTGADDAPSVVFGAVDDGGLAGAVGVLYESRDKLRHSATIFGMYVAPAKRNGGIGQALVDAAVDHARTRAVKNVQLSVTEGNDAAERLYARCGFVRWGVQPAAVAVGGRLIGKVHMWRDLEQRHEGAHDCRSAPSPARQ